MARRQLPPQIRKVEVLDRKTGKPVVRYQLTVDAGTDPSLVSVDTYVAGSRQNSRRATR